MSKKNSGRRVWRGVTTTTASLLAISVCASTVVDGFRTDIDKFLGMYNLLVVIRGQMGYGFLQIVYLVVIHRLLAEFFRRHRQIIQRFQSSSDIRCPEQRNKQYYSLHPQQYNARNLYDIPKDLNVISVLLLI